MCRQLSIEVSFPARPLENAREFPPHRLSDAQLAHAARAGSSAAWDELWDRHSSAVRRVVAACLGADSAIDDLVQEAFLALFRSLDRLERPESLRAFLMGTAARLSAFELRTRGRRFRWLRLTPTGTLPDLPMPEDGAARESMVALNRILHELGPELRGVFVLRYVEDLPPREIAAALGYSEAKVKRQIARARERVHLLSSRDPALAGFVPTGLGEGAGS